GSNGCFPKCDRDLAPKPRALCTAAPNFSKAAPVGYDAWPPQAAHPSNKHTALLRMTLELKSNDPGRDSRAGTSRPPLGGRGHSGALEECRAAGGTGRRSIHLRCLL